MQIPIFDTNGTTISETFVTIVRNKPLHINEVLQVHLTEDAMGNSGRARIQIRTLNPGQPRRRQIQQDEEIPEAHADERDNQSSASIESTFVTSEKNDEHEGKSEPMETQEGKKKRRGRDPASLHRNPKTGRFTRKAQSTPEKDTPGSSIKEKIKRGPIITDIRPVNIPLDRPNEETSKRRISGVGTNSNTNYDTKPNGDATSGTERTTIRKSTNTERYRRTIRNGNCGPTTGKEEGD